MCPEVNDIVKVGASVVEINIHPDCTGYTVDLSDAGSLQPISLNEGICPEANTAVKVGASADRFDIYPDCTGTRLISARPEACDSKR